MSKNFLIYGSAVVLVGFVVWLFVNKTRNISEEITLKPTPVSTSSPQATLTPISDDSTGNLGNNEWAKLPSGLEYQDIVVGQGAEAKNGDAISAHYLGTLQDGTKFDSSYDRGQPFTFLLGKGTVIKGWDEGLLGMKVGGKRKLIIPPNLGYGNQGAGGVIPPGATLLFDIELVAVETPAQ